jgi:hypothetical protein
VTSRDARAVAAAPMAFSPRARQHLKPVHRRALDAAANIVIDNLGDDIDACGPGAASRPLACHAYLPARHAAHYDADFLRRFLVCAVVVGWKQRAGDHALACVAEHLAFRYIAEVTLEYGANVDDWGPAEERDFHRFVEAVTEGVDLSPVFEGPAVARTPEGRALADVATWFRPFSRENPVHPYCDEETEARPRAT